MLTYFKPLRRKFGVLTLVAACVFTGEWVRSLVSVNVFSFGNSQLMSSNGEMNWVQSDGPPLDAAFTFASGDTREQSIGAENARRWKCFGFGVSEYDWVKRTTGPTETRHIRCYTVAYWSIVMPLTLLTAWLLLGKPRGKKTKPMVAKMTTESQ